MGWLADSLFGKPSTTPPASTNNEPPAASHGDDGWKQQDPSDDTIAQKQTSVYAQNNNGIAPEVAISRIEPIISSSGKNLELWVTLANHSRSDVEVTDIECLGQQRQLNRFLKPGESHDILMFSGAVPRTDADHDSSITFKDRTTGVYYKASHYIRFHCTRHTDGDYYVPDKFSLQPPIEPL